MAVRAYIKKESDGHCVVYCRRDRFKHLFRIGTHKDTDTAFRLALKSGDVEWAGRIFEDGKLF